MPRTTCSYSVSSKLKHSSSVASQSLASKPRLALVSVFFVSPSGTYWILLGGGSSQCNTSDDRRPGMLMRFKPLSLMHKLRVGVTQ